MVQSNDPGRVNREKGYRVVNWLDYSIAIWDVNGIHLSSGCGRSQQPPLLELRLILVVNRAAVCSLWWAKVQAGALHWPLFFQLRG